MSILIIGDTERKQIAAAIAAATAKPVTFEDFKKYALPAVDGTLDLSDRPPDFFRPPSEHLILGNIRVAYSHEQQPSGFFRHISASVPRPGKLPNPIAMAAICKEFGFTDGMCEIISSSGRLRRESVVGRLWLEEFDPGHHAVNVVELIGPAEQGSVH